MRFSITWKSFVRGEFTIIDVRDEDFEGGHIYGAVNLPSETFYDRKILDKMVRDWGIPSPEKPRTILVFHCMKSQQRGPTCARIFSEHLSTLEASEKNEM